MALFEVTPEQPNVEIYYEGQTISHGTGTMHVDGTSGQFLKLAASDHFDIETSGVADYAGVLYKDTTAGNICSILNNGFLKWKTAVISGTLDDEIQIGADGFPAYKLAGVAVGKIIKTDGEYTVVKMY